MLGAILGAAIPAIASLWGAHKQNQAAQKEADKNRQFQADQSATAIQRQVADFRAAGLNPALAYGAGGASSATGSVAPVNNEIEQAVNGAKSWKISKDQLDMQKQQNEADLRIKNAQEAGIKAKNASDISSSLLMDQQRAATIQAITQGNIANPLLTRKLTSDAFMAEQTQQPMLAQLRAQAMMTQLGIPAAKNAASWEEFISGTPNKFLRAGQEAGKFIPNFKFK